MLDNQPECFLGNVEHICLKLFISHFERYFMTYCKINKAHHSPEHTFIWWNQVPAVTFSTHTVPMHAWYEQLSLKERSVVRAFQSTCRNFKLSQTSGISQLGKVYADFWTSALFLYLYIYFLKRSVFVYIQILISYFLCLVIISFFSICLAVKTEKKNLF